MRFITCMLAVTLLVAGGCGPSPEKRDPTAMLQKAREELQHNNPAAAVELAESALIILRRRHAAVQSIASAETAAAEANLAAGNSQAALKHWHSALTVADNLFISRKIYDTEIITGDLVRVGHQWKVEHAEMVPVLVLFGNAMSAKRKVIDAQNAWKEALEGGPKQADASRRKFAAAIFALSGKYEDSEQREHAEKLYKDAATWCAEDPQLIKAIVAEADYQMTLEKYSCRNLLMAVLPVVENDSASSPEIKMELLRKTGVIAEASQDYEASRQIHSRLLSAFDKTPGTAQREKRDVLEYLTTAEFKLKRWPDAKAHFRRLADISRTMTPPDLTAAAKYELTIKNIDTQSAQETSAAKKK